MHKVEINKEPVELYKILKFEGLTTTGGEAKAPDWGRSGDGQRRRGNAAASKDAQWRHHRLSRGTDPADIDLSRLRSVTGLSLENASSLIGRIG